MFGWSSWRFPPLRAWHRRCVHHLRPFEAVENIQRKRYMKVASWTYLSNEMIKCISVDSGVLQHFFKSRNMLQKQCVIFVNTVWAFQPVSLNTTLKHDHQTTYASCASTSSSLAAVANGKVSWPSASAWRRLSASIMIASRNSKSEIKRLIPRPMVTAVL